MPLVTLLHNPTAGGKNHSAAYLASMIRTAGYECRYASIEDEGWQNFSPDTSFIAIAGGDGTVRKVAKTLLEQDQRYPIALLPSGTANNIALSLQIKEMYPQLIANWKDLNLTQVDIGTVKGLPNGNFFLESFGYGLLPALMREMHVLDKHETDTPEKKMKAAKRLLHSLTLSYQPRHCRVIIDGRNHSGEYILAEVLNMPFVGANLNLAPGGDPGDGLFDIILITAERRRAFADFVSEPETNPIGAACLDPLKGRHIQLQWEGSDAHLDDEQIEVEAPDIYVDMSENAFQFLI